MVSRTGEVCKSETSRGGSSGGELEVFLLCRATAALLRARAGKAGGPFASPFAPGTARMGAVPRGAVPEAVVVVVVLLLLLLLLPLVVVVVVVAVAVEVVVAVVVAVAGAVVVAVAGAVVVAVAGAVVVAVVVAVAVAGAVAVVLRSTVVRSTIEGLIISSEDI